MVAWKLAKKMIKKISVDNWTIENISKTFYGWKKVILVGKNFQHWRKKNFLLIFLKFFFSCFIFFFLFRENKILI